MYIIVYKFGGSSVAGAEQFKKVKAIVEADPERRVVVVSAAGKRNADDHKLTDLLYLCHAHLNYGVSCSDIFSTIEQRLTEIRDELGLSYGVEAELKELERTLSKDTPVDLLVSRGEYFTSRLMAEYLGYTFVDAADCVIFSFDRAIAWFISGNEYQKHYYLPMEVEVKEDAAEYTFIRTYKPIDDRIGDIAYIQWGDGYAFIVNNTNCKSVRFTSGNEVYEEVIPDDTYPYVFFYLSDHTNSTLQFEFLDAEGNELR